MVPTKERSRFREILVQVSRARETDHPVERHLREAARCLSTWAVAAIEARRDTEPMERVFDFDRLDLVLQHELQPYVALLEEVDRTRKVPSPAPRDVGDDG